MVFKCLARIKTMPTRTQVIKAADVLGIGASGLCAVHCLVMPFVLSALPFLSNGMLSEETVHWSLAGFVVTFCFMGILPGYLQHRKHRVLMPMLFGLTLVLLATFVLDESMELPVITLGNALVITSHFLNRKFMKKCCDSSCH